MSIRVCPLCGTRTRELICPREGLRTVLPNRIRTADQPKRIRKAYKLLGQSLGELDGMELFRAVEYATGEERLVSIRAPRDEIWFEGQELNNFYKTSYAASLWRSETVAALVEFGIDDLSGWAYRVFRQPLGYSIKHLIRTNGVFGPGAACRLAIAVTRVQQEAIQLGREQVDFGMHQVYYHHNDGHEYISILGLGLVTEEKKYPHLPPPLHPTARFLAHVLLGASSNITKRLPLEQPNGVIIPDGIRRLYFALSTNDPAITIRDPGVLIAALETLERGDDLPHSIAPPVGNDSTGMTPTKRRASSEGSMVELAETLQNNVMPDKHDVAVVTQTVGSLGNSLVPAEHPVGTKAQTVTARHSVREGGDYAPGANVKDVQIKTRTGGDKPKWRLWPALMWGVVAGALTYGVAYWLAMFGLPTLF